MQRGGSNVESAFILQQTFQGLKRMLKLAQRVSPVALKSVVGTKADCTEERKVASEDVVVR